MKFIKDIHEKFTSSQDKKNLVENFFSLSFLQIANYILPLITLPYLVRVIGPGKYGLIAFAQALIQYFITLTDYGFILSATRDISVNRNDAKKISEIFSSVMIVKFVLMALSFTLLCFMIMFLSKFRQDWSIYIFTFGIVLGNFLFPTWFLQGMERMKYIALLNIVSKLIFTILIFIFVRREYDYIRVPIITSLGSVVAGLLSLWSIYKLFNVKFVIPKFESIVTQLKNGWHIFISMFSINFYTSMNVFVLGFFTDNVVVGYYAAGEKLIIVAKCLFEPAFQALYPYISKLAAESRERAVKNLRILLYLTFCVSVLMFLVFIFGTYPIVLLILGRKFVEAVIIVKILSPLLLILPVAHILGSLTLLPFNLDRYFSGIYFSGSFINIFLLFITLYIFRMGAIGAAISSTITQTILTLMMYMVLRKHNIKVLYGN